MLTRFAVTGFKNFKEKIELDFTDIRDYQFNNNCIKDNLLSKIIIYGKNSVGKSNLGLALLDITTHLTEKNVTPSLYDYYLNADAVLPYAEFQYDFCFDGTKISYLYRKTDYRKMLYEEVRIDDKTFFSYNLQQEELDVLFGASRFVNLIENFKEKNLSFLRYFVNNSREEDIKPLSDLMKFVSRMLWFRSLNENRYIGHKTDSTDYLKFIFEGNNLKEFEAFLHKSGVEERLLALENPSGEMALYFDKKKPIPFLKVASNGTKALYTIFYWLKTSKDLSFLFIDEFDAYYHVELAETIVEMLESYSGFQVILTSHNTNLLSNRIMRPDCYFILTPEKLVSFANATKRELREGHNLEKLYLSGEFDG